MLRSSFGTTQVQPTTPSLAQRPPEDQCRADDKVKCGDGSYYICRDQLCDGHVDCPDGDDEENCLSPTPICKRTDLFAWVPVVDGLCQAVSAVCSTNFSALSLPQY